MVLVLSKKDVEALLGMRDAIEAVEEAFSEFATGKAVMPTRIVMPINRHNGTFFAMPAYLDEADALGIKVVTSYNNNRNLGLPTIIAVVVLLNSVTGEPIAIMGVPCLV